MSAPLISNRKENKVSVVSLSNANLIKALDTVKKKKRDFVLKEMKKRGLEQPV